MGGKNFNRLLSRFVTYARSANAIDETRADFDRVPWGPTVKGPQETAGIPTFKQYFFAGNHSDVGGQLRRGRVSAFRHRSGLDGPSNRVSEVYRTRSLALPMSRSGKRLSEAGDRAAESPRQREWPSTRDPPASDEPAHPAHFSQTGKSPVRLECVVGPGGLEPPTKRL
jgi:hypothetical protein